MAERSTYWQPPTADILDDPQVLFDGTVKLCKLWEEPMGENVIQFRMWLQEQWQKLDSVLTAQPIVEVEEEFTERKKKVRSYRPLGKIMNLFEEVELNGGEDVINFISGEGVGEVYVTISVDHLDRSKLRRISFVHEKSWFDQNMNSEKIDKNIDFLFYPGGFQIKWDDRRCGEYRFRDD